jgi:replicative DNA helicase
MKEKNFGHLGSSFQQSLIKSIIEDKKYGETIIDVIDSKYFDNNSFKYIMENLKELYVTYNKIPDYNTLGQKIMAENTTNETGKIHLDTLNNIKESDQDTSYVQDTALRFCKQQNLKRELKKVSTIIENGEFESYNKIEQIIQKALQVGISNEDAVDVFDNIEDALKKDYRHPLPTGINGIDNLLKGGLGRGELGVVLAPTGTGKTTILTKIANTSFIYGFNVLQIIFEDNVNSVKRKHYTIWTGIAPDDQPDRESEVIEKVNDVNKNTNGEIKILKLPSDSVSISEIKSKIRKFKNEGFNIDLLIIDYVDCLSPERSTDGEEWKGEGSIMRSLEAMTTEFDIAIWTATQGNRNSISSEVVTTDQMGGSIKKAQIGHVIISIGKTIEQKEHKLATLTLLKSRIGADGVIFQNCRFDNEYLIIDTESQNTLLGHEEQKIEKERNRAKEAFQRRQEMSKK